MDFIEKLEKASKIHNNIKKNICNNFILNNSALDIVNYIENEISTSLPNEKNSGIAFPTGLSVNNVVAHYTPTKNDNFYITNNDVLKIDYGVHVDGYIIDSAFTFNNNNKFTNICKASEDAVNQVIKNIGVDSKFKDLSRIIEETVKSYEYEDKGVLKPVKIIENVYGHNIKQYSIHGGKFLYPTVQKDDTQIVDEDEIMAIEVFTSNGFGMSKLDYDVKNYSHYKLKNEFMDRNIPLFPIKKMNLISDFIKETYGTLPFCPRFINKTHEDITINNLQTLFKFNIIDSYPPLLECKDKSVSAQFEHTICVREKGVIDFNK